MTATVHSPVAVFLSEMATGKSLWLFFLTLLSPMGRGCLKDK
jgi:hypothetical protein